MTFQPNCQAIVYDAALDFSLNSNPNGVWSYGYSDTLGSTFVLDDLNAQESSGLYTWRNASQEPNGPNFAYNPTASPIIIDDTATGGTDHMVWAPYQLSLGPGSGFQYSVLRFTPPESGEYQVQGAFSSVDQYYGAKTDVHILVNGTSFFDGLVWGTDSVVSFDQPLQLNVGDVLDFAVGPFGGNWGWDTTGLSATITPVPEPSTIGLFAAGLLLVYRVRSKQSDS